MPFIFHTLLKSVKFTVLFLQFICNILDSVDDGNFQTCLVELNVQWDYRGQDSIKQTNKKHSQCTQTNNDSVCNFEVYKCMPCQETLELWENQSIKRHITEFPLAVQMSNDPMPSLDYIIAIQWISKVPWNPEGL